jgi:hypothetical protein
MFVPCTVWKRVDSPNVTHAEMGYFHGGNILIHKNSPFEGPPDEMTFCNDIPAYDFCNTQWQLTSGSNKFRLSTINNKHDVIGSY